MKAYFMPLNVNQIIQLLKEGILEHLKRKYRQKFLGNLTEDLEEQGVIEYRQQVTLKDFVMGSRIVEKIKRMTLQK